jgi:hypothetical protein
LEQHPFFLLEIIALRDRTSFLAGVRLERCGDSTGPLTELSGEQVVMLTWWQQTPTKNLEGCC